MKSSQKMSYAEKMQQAGREAKITLIALVFIIAFWTLCGFGLSQSSFKIFHTPLWIVLGCLGTWVFSCLVAVFLIKYVFKNFSLDD